MLIAPGEYMKIMAAIKDPKTGQIYTGESHSTIIDEMEDDNPVTFARLRKIYVAEGSLSESKYVGFISNDAVTKDSPLLSRAEALKKWGVFYSQDIRRMR